jgi:SpoVK/Ycf46/Vps4 family AAA+-type ATPase
MNAEPKKTANSARKRRFRSDVEGRQLGWYVRNCAVSRMAQRLETLILSRVGPLKGGSTDDSDVVDDPSKAGWEGEIDVVNSLETEADACRSIQVLSRRRRELRALLKVYAGPALSGDCVEVNVGFARKEFALDDTDTEILLLLVRYECNPELQGFADAVLERLRSPVDAVAALLAIERQEVRQRLSCGGRLIDGGLICLQEQELGPLEHELAGRSGCLRLLPTLRAVMYRTCHSLEQWAGALLGEPLTTPLSWDDFEHVGPLRDLAARAIFGAIKADAAGLNVMLHGPVGTGKTEFAKALARQAGVLIWSVGETDEEGEEPSRSERLAALKLAQRLLTKRRGAVLLLDEAEDVLATDMMNSPPFQVGNGRHSKVYLNRLLECNPVPVIWACNDVLAMDPAVLRRMTLAVEIKTPGRVARRRIWQQALKEAGLALPTEAVERLANRHAVPAAVVANALRAAVLAGGGEPEVEEAIGGVSPLLGIGPAVAESDDSDFDPALVQCDVDLSRLAERLARPGASRQWSLCISGPTGTGKTQFVRHLAGRLGMEVMPQRASDLLSMWVGGSEKQIAGAFQAARARNALLVIDEADSLLADRREAVRSWEVTQVNEMLTWMESHPLPFVCTTNLVDRLDRASLRRFTLKLKFKPLSGGQARLAFERFFGMPVPRQLPEGLTPGDFAIVRRKRDLFGVTDFSVLADWLEEEVAAKGTRVRPIGFVVPND